MKVSNKTVIYIDPNSNIKSELRLDERTYLVPSPSAYLENYVLYIAYIKKPIF